MDFDHLTILSFHRMSGDCMDDTTIANQPKVLLLVIEGPVRDCCKQDIKFIHVQCPINLAALISINPYPMTTKTQATYYIKLPQGTQALVNGNNQNYNLVTFWVPQTSELLLLFKLR
jgi:hypothetical protein